MKLKKLESNAKHPIRSPEENVIRVDYDGRFKLYSSYENLDKSFEEHSEDPDKLDYIRERAIYNLPLVLAQMHGRGDPIESIAHRLIEFVKYAEFLRKKSPSANFISNMVTPDSCGEWIICLLLAPDENVLNKLREFVTIEDDERLYSFDVLLGAFWPDWQLPKKYNRRSRGKYIMAWSDAFTRAIASDDREAGLKKYMKEYERLVKPFWPYLWKPWEIFKVTYSPDGNKIYGNANYQFAFEAAFAVCAYDLDDEGFRDHRYYPRELVDYYRKHIRNTRDAWRNEGVGSGLKVKLPPEPKKIDLAKSKSKNFKRWLELVSDGDADAVASIVSTLGNIRRFKEPQSVFEEFSDSGVAICVDVKDDAALERALLTFIESRKMENYHTPETENSSGFARNEELLAHATKFLSQTPYSLHLIDLKSDSLGAVFVRDEFEDEFLPMTNRFMY